MRRALLTAAPVAAGLGVEQDCRWCHGELYEVGGCYVGATTHPGARAADIEAEFGVRCHRVGSAGWFAGREHPEHSVAAGLRVERLVDWIESTLRAEEKDVATGLLDTGLSDTGLFQTLIVIAHGDLMTRWLRHWLGVSWRTSLAFVHGNTGITELHWHGERGLLLVGSNDLAHLPPDLRSDSRITDAWWRYSTPDLAIDRYQGPAGVARELWSAAVSLRQELLLARELTSLADYQKSDDRSVHFLARIAGRFAGTVQYDPELGRLRQMVVAPEYRGGRVGRALVEAVREEAARRGRPELRVHAWSESVPFYQRLGFRPCGDEVTAAAMPWRPLSLCLA
jgi:GNAT superfamily N-acetyltransferase/broad specificity phosphatase PhoE